MERFLQFLDDVDDLYGMFGLIVERLRQVLLVLFSYLAVVTGAIAGIGFALVYPPLALPTSTLLIVMLLYHSVTSPPSSALQTA